MDKNTTFMVCFGINFSKKQMGKTDKRFLLCRGNIDPAYSFSFLPGITK
jgi:hypothetical protein